MTILLWLLWLFKMRWWIFLLRSFGILEGFIFSLQGFSDAFLRIWKDWKDSSSWMQGLEIHGREGGNHTNTKKHEKDKKAGNSILSHPRIQMVWFGFLFCHQKSVIYIDLWGKSSGSFKTQHEKFYEIRTKKSVKTTIITLGQLPKISPSNATCLKASPYLSFHFWQTSPCQAVFLEGERHRTPSSWARGSPIMTWSWRLDPGRGQLASAKYSLYW